MTLDGNLFIDSYLSWLKDNIQASNINGYLQISTPFLDRHNDHIQFYIKEDDGLYTITDDGYTINDLALSGCDINTYKRRETLEYILKGFGVALNDDALVVKANRTNLAQKKHFLIQAMLSVNDMFMLTQSRVSGLFFEDVATFLSDNEIRFVPDIQFVGKSGLSHTFNFVIPASKTKPERLIHTINSPTKQQIQSVLFAWSDVSKSRTSGSQMYVFLNDENNQIRSDIISAFTEYSTIPIPWSERYGYLDVLSA